MKKKRILSVFCNGSSKFPHFATMTGRDGGKRRFIGWIEQSPGEWVPNPEPEKVYECSEYKRALVLGDLLPADQETAAIAGVPFKSK